MRPNRILVGEIRGEEALDMIQAMTSGHDGCLGVLHAGTPQDAISRLMVMALSRGLMLPLWAINKQLATGLDVILQHELLPDGTRKITRITEVRGVEGEDVALQDVFALDDDGVWRCPGVEPLFMRKFRKLGVELPAGTLGNG
jgi:pilus assembly protein CpaF